MKTPVTTIFFLLLLFIALGLCGWALGTGSFPVTSEQPKNLVYSYGDSITTAGYQDGIPFNYVHRMSALHAGLTANHSTDGGGMNTTWGIYHFDRHWINGTDVFVYMFINDAQYHLPYNQTAENYITLYHRAKDRGAVPVPCIPVSYSFPPCGAWCDQKNQTKRNAYLESALRAKGISFVRMYDAIDRIPGNDMQDEMNHEYQPDGVHPGITGHQEMAEYLWEQLKEFNNPWHGEKIPALLKFPPSR